MRKYTVAFAFAFAACSSNNNNNNGAQDMAQQQTQPDMTASGPCGSATNPIMVGVNLMQFAPTDCAVAKGDTVHWTWVSDMHSVTSDGNMPSFDSALVTTPVDLVTHYPASELAFNHQVFDWSNMTKSYLTRPGNGSASRGGRGRAFSLLFQFLLLLFR